MSTGVGSGIDFVLRLTSIAVLAHLLTPDEFGLVGIVTAVTAIGAQVVQLGLLAATVQRTDISHDQVTNLFWVNASFGALLTVVFCGLAPVLAAFFHEPRLLLITAALSASFLLSGLSVQHEALLTRKMQQDRIALVRVGSTFLSVLVAVGMALTGLGYWALVAHEVSRALFLTVGFWLASRWVPRRPAWNAHIGGLLRFGWHLTLSQLLNAVVLNLDRLLLGRFFGAESVGFYRQAQQLILAPVEQLQHPIQSVAQPALCMLKDDPERYRRYFRQIVSAIGFITMPLAAFCGVYAEEATLMMLGETWLEAAALVQIFAVWAFVRPVLGLAGVVLITLGQGRRLLLYSYARNVTFVTLTIIGVKWGITGVATAQVCSTLILLTPCLYYSFARAPVAPGLFFDAIRTPVTGSAVMIAGLLLFRRFAGELSVLTSIVAAVPVGAALYFAGCLLTADGRREIRVMISHLVSSVRSQSLRESR